MCGIVGIHYFDRSRVVTPGDLALMTDAIVHRGPDDQGAACFGHSGIAMRRLSIIDLGGGHQPIFSSNRRQAIVFNGEAFDFQDRRAELEAAGHSFTSHSDTEVVLQLYLRYGDSFVDHVNGMYGLAIWDADRDRLLLARDRVGIKPLYYYLDRDQLVYASEIKSILALPWIKAELEPRHLDLYLKYGFTPAPHTLFKRIHKLPPGHLLETTADGVAVRSYWHLSYRDKLTGSADDIAAELHSLLHSSVRYQMIADVPLGAFLSGGMDSSSIVHLMRELGSTRVNTYNIGYGPRYAEHDESAEARAIANVYGTNHHEICADPDVQTMFPRLIGYMDEPVADSSFVVTHMVSKLASESVKVILSGVGGDELFGGYRRYQQVALNRLWHTIPGPLRAHVLTPLLNALPVDRNNRLLNYFRLAKGFARDAELTADRHYERMISILSDVRVANDAGHEPVTDPFAGLLAECDGADLLDKIMYFDLKTSLPEQLLLLTDKMSMACSLEVRVPYLDHRVVEFAARIPVGLKLRGRELRHIQRRAFKGRLPDAVLNRRKRGFGAPIGAWLRGDLRPMVEDLLHPDVIRRQGLFDVGKLRRMIDSHMQRQTDSTDALLALLTFQIWHGQHFGH